MKTQPYSATIGRWLQDQFGKRCLAGLTGQDWPALKAAVHIVELWTSADSSGRKYAAIAFRHVVESMQPNLRYLAFHAIAHVADWSHREELWDHADLERLEDPGVCEWEPAGRRVGIEVAHA